MSYGENTYITMLRERKLEHQKNVDAYLSGDPRPELAHHLHLGAAEHIGAIKELDHLIAEFSK